LSGQPFRELDDTDLGVCLESIDKVAHHDVESNEIFLFRMNRAIIETLHDAHQELVRIDFEGHVDRTSMIRVTKDQRERLVDGKAKVVDGSDGQPSATSDRSDRNANQPYETHR
jgi:hypothetical protein